MVITKIEQIGEIVRMERKKAGLKQAECAALCGVGVRFFSELENGKPTLEIGKVLKVLMLLGLEIILENK